MSETLSLLAGFDDLRRYMGVLSDGAAEEGFLEFVRLQEECRRGWQSALQEAQRLQRELDKSLKAMADLEGKLFHARRLLEQQSKAKREAEMERDQMEKKIVAVADIITHDRNIKEETKNKFSFLNNYAKKRKSKNHLLDEQQGNEINSTGSFLSDLSLTQSEDDFLDMKTSKVWRKHRPSYPKDTGTYVGGKRSRSRVSAEQKKSRMSNRCMEIGPNDKIVAQTKVIIPQNDGPIQAESVIEAIPVNNNNHDVAYNKENNPNNIEMKTPSKKSPKRAAFTPSAPPLQEFFSKNSPSDFKRNLMRKHNFTSRTFLKSDTCTHCQKKIRFGVVGLKCRDCRVCIHPDCKESLTITCVPQSTGTPHGKGAFGVISDYAPPMAPMIPALIVHCVNEIETRGLNEVGIYRVSATEREVKALKERFFRGKSTPNLSSIDIHVLCGCVKDFLRSLREPLIPVNLWKDFSNAVQNINDDLIQRDLLNAIDKLPQANRDTLAFLLMHFQRIDECPEVKMPLANLARVFGPTIVGYSSSDPNQHVIFTETVIQYSVMEKLLRIPTDYWSQYVCLNDIPQEKEIQTPHRGPHKVVDCFYASPLPNPGSTFKKDGRFYSTPPYPSKKAK